MGLLSVALVAVHARGRVGQNEWWALTACALWPVAEGLTTGW
jgi:hypothetical protein